MVISPLAASDTEEVVKLARINWAESRFQWLPFDETKIRANLARMIEAPATSNCAIVARNNTGRLVGYLAGSIEEYFFCRARIASSVFLFVDPAERGGRAALRLVLAFRQWAINRDAVEMYIGVAGGVLMERTGRFLQRLGLRLTGGNYSLWLKGPEAGQARTGPGGYLRQPL
jgi:hypothetical protein